MKRIYCIMIISLLVWTESAFTQEDGEPLLKEYRKQFKNEYFSLGTVMQFVFDYQGNRIQPGKNGFSVANMRLKLKGQFDGGYGYFFQTKFDKSPAILDAYMTYRFNPAMSLQIGRFKAPFSAEFLIPAPDIDFVNRSRVVTALAPGRQIGIQLNGLLLNDILNYSVSIANGNSPDQNGNDNNDFLYAGRIAFFPGWFDDIKNSGVELGLNTAVSRDRNITFAGGLIPAFTGDRMLIGMDIRLRHENLLLAGEYIRASLEPVRGGDTTPAGFHATAGYRILPNLQVLLRWDQFDPDRPAGQNSTSDWLVLGMNLWPTGVTEFQLNYTVDLDESDLDHHQILFNAQIVF